MTLQEYLNTHPSKKEVILPYEEKGRVDFTTAEEYVLVFDRKNNRLFIGLPNSMKREEIK